MCYFPSPVTRKSTIGDDINKKIIGPLANANKLSDMPDFNDATKLGSGKEKVDRLTNLIAIFENKALDFSKNRADGDDILGDAYEYLLRHFATESGKSKGQYGTIGKVALIKHLEKPATLNSGVFVIRPIEGAFHPDFFYYLLCSNVFSTFLTQLSAGSTINHLYQKDFVNFIYKTPSTIAEQTAIATILSDMDAEIATLETKLAKTRQIKQGMMHNLLTGRIRLK